MADKNTRTIAIAIVLAAVILVCGIGFIVWSSTKDEKACDRFREAVRELVFTVAPPGSGTADLSPADDQANREQMIEAFFNEGEVTPVGEDEPVVRPEGCNP